jgi:alkylation response protein AidB-like acyl-CoA dehydrogenase
MREHKRAPAMQLALSPADEAFRAEVRRFLDEKLTPDLREAGKKTGGVFTDPPATTKWHKALYEKGWIAPAWPKQYGGPGWNEMHRYIFASECAAAHVPLLPAFGVTMCGPVLMKFGTPEQKAFYLPRILSGEDLWCQGYSEPGSGSDLASLQTKAVRDGDHYVINGTKIWTTHAHFANRMFCLVRTGQTGKPQEGITFLLLETKTPGFTVRPIITMAGDHEVNQCFFDNVRVPVENRVGEEGQGWTVAKYLLEFERGTAYAAGLQAKLANVKKAAAIERSNGEPLAADQDFARKLVETEIELQGLMMTEHRVMSQLSQGQNPGPASSLLKARGSEVSQRITELGIEALAAYIAPFEPEARKQGANEKPVVPEHGLVFTPQYLNTRAATIYGGSSEVQRNIMSKLIIGL